MAKVVVQSALMLLTVLVVETFCLNIQIPSNFYGSKEVFSGYLSNSDVIIDAYSLNNDHVTVSGLVIDVERKLASIDTKGKFVKTKLYKQSFIDISSVCKLVL